MGQSTSIDIARRVEIQKRFLPEAWKRVDDLELAAAAEKAAGGPPACGSKQALLQAARGHREQLLDEMDTLIKREVYLSRGDLFGIPKRPKPTPPWEEVEALLTMPEPSTPTAGGSSPVCRQRGSSSDEAAVLSEAAAAPAGDVHLGEAAQLLPGGAGLSAPRQRRRSN